MKTYYAQYLCNGADVVSNVSLQVEDGVIVAITSAQEHVGEYDEYLFGIVNAGFIDIQVNGGGGVLFNHQQSVQALSQMAMGHAQFGTTAMLPTLITDNLAKMQSATDAMQQAMAQSLPGVVGIHFEGPHLALPKKGIHSDKQIRSVSDKELDLYTRQDIGKVMVTVAPENVPSDIIKMLVSAGVCVSLGHSNADFDTVLAAIDAGASNFTHLFNAMSGLTAREPGLIGAAFCQAQTYSGIIADFEHVHPANCYLAYQILGANKLLLVTDSMAHVGSQLTTQPWLGDTITRKGNRLSLNDGSIAGSCLDMSQAVANMYGLITNKPYLVRRKQALIETLNMASRTPANLLGLSTHGQLVSGNRADFVVLDVNLKTQASFIAGELIAGVLPHEPDAQLSAVLTV